MYLRRIALLLIACAALPLYSGCSSVAAERPVTHVVVVWLNDEFNTPEGIDDTIERQEVLREIPGLISLTVGKMIPSERPIVDSSYQFASVFRFESVAAMRAYLSHPVHVEFIDTVAKPRASRTLVYDFQ